MSIAFRQAFLRGLRRYPGDPEMAAVHAGMQQRRVSKSSKTPLMPNGLLEPITEMDWGKGNFLATAKLKTDDLEDADQLIRRIASITQPFQGLILPRRSDEAKAKTGKISIANQNWVKFVNILEAKNIQRIRWPSNMVYTVEQLRGYPSGVI